MKIFLGTTLILAAAALPVAACAEPLLRSDITVEHAIVTVGDLFAGAGDNAGRAMFRAPAPGTTGTVSIEAIRLAASRAGLTGFETPAVDSVRVERAGVPVSFDMIEDLVRSELDRRGALAEGAIIRLSLDAEFPALQAATAGEPVRLTALSFTPGPGLFSARFAIAGYSKPLELRGRIDLLIEAPHLTASLGAGAILSPGDLEMRPVQMQYAGNGGLATIDQLLGKELKRPAREGMMIRASDVAPPEVIGRSDMVTLHYAHGPLSLTVRGQALNAAAEGEAVAVLNLVSKKIVHGVASGRGSVELVPFQADAGLES